MAIDFLGAGEILGAVEQAHGVKAGGTTADGKITLEFAECLGACEGAPAVMINDVQRHGVTDPDAVIAELT